MATNDIRVMKFLDEKHAEYVEKVKAAAPGSDFSVLVQFQPLTKFMVAHSRKASGNILDLEDVVVDGPALNWLTAVTVDTAENQKKIATLTLEYRNAINKYATSIGTNKNWEYLDYALGDQDPIKHYGTESVRYLQVASKEYDPQ